MFKHISRMVLPFVDSVWVFDNSTPNRSKGRLDIQLGISVVTLSHKCISTAASLYLESQMVVGI